MEPAMEVESHAFPHPEHCRLDCNAQIVSGLKATCCRHRPRIPDVADAKSCNGVVSKKVTNSVVNTAPVANNAPKIIKHRLEPVIKWGKRNKRPLAVVAATAKKKRHATHMT